MREISTLELSVLSRELASLNGYHIDKFYELGNGSFRFRLSRQGTQLNLQCLLGRTVGATRYVEAAEQPTPFALAVRKRISGAVIGSVEQYNDDRLLLIRLEKADASMNIVLEMFGKGNMVIAEQDMRIMLAYRVHDFKDRSVRPGATYVPPHNAPITMAGTSGAQARLAELAKAADQNVSIMSFLNRNVNIGAQYAENALLHLRIDPKARLSQSLGSLPDIAKALADEVAESAAPSYCMYLDGGNAVDYSVVPLVKYSTLEKRTFASMQELLDEFYYSVMPKETIEENALAKELAASIEKQKHAIAEMGASTALNREAGRKIFEMLNQINMLVSYAREHRHATVEELRERFPELKINGLDLKDKIIKLEL